ncbi:MAG: hypothetical protein IKL09_00240, partial [Clostridia bacterium]|nr:hypothetical protein [Clostridia bacterium]
INSLCQLSDLLDDMQSELNKYDEEIIRSMIKDATVVSNTELKINLHCGLTFTEHLPHYYSKRSQTA